MYIKRLIEPAIKKYLSIFPAVVLTGPRQSGKSTLLKTVFSNYAYVTFDKVSHIEAFDSDPEGFLAKYSDQVIFDEIQRVPTLFSYIKLLIDQDREKNGKFILTGSSQFQLLKSITESLAGRAGNLSLLPFQYSEIPSAQRDKQMLLGSYPEVVAKKYGNAYEWFDSYIQNYLERDVRQLSQLGNLKDFRKFISLLAARTGQEFNASSYASDLGVNYKTIQSWLSLLEASYIVFSIEPYLHNLGKRLIKRPKVYFWDTGLACFLTGIRQKEVLEKGVLGGPVFENYLIAETYKTILHTKKDQKLYYYRAGSGLEADLIIEDREKQKVTFVEIKKNQTARPLMADNIRLLLALEEEYHVHTGYMIDGLLLYTGTDSGKFYERIKYQSWKEFLNPASPRRA